jgi:hypothetical protein
MAKLKVETKKIVKTEVDPGDLATAIVNDWTQPEINSFMFTFLDEISGMYAEDLLLTYLHNYGFNAQLKKWGEVRK